MHADRHAARVGVADLDMAIDHHGGADEAHGPHADRVAELLQLQLQLGDLGVRVAVADHAQAGGLLAEGHANVLGAADTDPDDRRLTG